MTEHDRTDIRPVLVAVVIRELGPLAANLIVIGRSGNAIAAELGGMKSNGEVTCQGKGPGARWRYRASKRSTSK